MLINIISLYKHKNRIINNKGDGVMRKNNIKNNKNNPIEKHDTAAWANKEKAKMHSNVNKPNETSVENAKKYVDNNHK